MEDEKKKLYPLAFTPITENEDWGSQCWAVADMGWRDSEVLGGWLDGNGIGDLMETYIERLVGDNVYYFYGRQFPLAVKTMDITGRLPLYVCPDDEISSQRYDALGRKKLWHISEAGPESRLFLGFKEPVSAADFYSKCLDGSIEELLNIVTPRKGENYLISPGTVHSASNVKITEIAESSDVDLKVSVWHKAAVNEELFVEDALDFTELGAYRAPARPSEAATGPEKCLADEKEFKINRIALSDTLHYSCEDQGDFLLLTSVHGDAAVRVQDGKNDGNYHLKSGSTLLIPAEVTDFYLLPMTGSCTILESSVHRTEKDEYTGETLQS